VDVEVDDMSANDADARRQALSALADGQADAAESACRAWREDAGARADWHTYQLIGEAMRSDDVRCAPQRDAQFLGRLRERLAAEPVVLAPTPESAPIARIARRNWAAPVAIAAGFAAVAGVLVVMRMAAPDGAAADRSALISQAATASAPAAAAGTDAKLIRNAELDRYLAAHRQYSNSSALAVPGGAVRNAAAAAPGR
jgi:sigma-E factor negative regulatory protein RseA